jgi:hypothetical protein
MRYYFTQALGSHGYQQTGDLMTPTVRLPLIVSPLLPVCRLSGQQVLAVGTCQRKVEGGIEETKLLRN